ncbi:MAG: hypothetical protein ACI81Y_002909, partial [Glaciecola sp.]
MKDETSIDSNEMNDFEKGLSQLELFDRNDES